MRRARKKPAAAALWREKTGQEMQWASHRNRLRLPARRANVNLMRIANVPQNISELREEMPATVKKRSAQVFAAAAKGKRMLFLRHPFIMRVKRAFLMNCYPVADQGVLKNFTEKWLVFRVIWTYNAIRQSKMPEGNRKIV